MLEDLLKKLISELEKDNQLQNRVINYDRGCIDDIANKPLSIIGKCKSKLTKTEKYILYKTLKGLPRLQIAAETKKSEHTVKAHLEHIYSKLGVTGKMGMYVAVIEELMDINKKFVQVSNEIINDFYTPYFVKEKLKFVIGKE